MRTVISLPNLFTLVRLPLAGAFLLADSTALRLVILGTASVSDFLDGWIARRTGHTTRYGALLDPITDKTFMLAAFTAFLVHGNISSREWGLLLARDWATAAGAIVAWWVPGLTPRDFQARKSGKVVTFLQLVAVLGLCLGHTWVRPMVVLVGSASIIAIADYTLALAWSVERRD
jgi:phosphatidylglycerophosphate synthase